MISYSIIIISVWTNESFNFTPVQPAFTWLTPFRYIYECQIAVIYFRREGEFRPCTENIIIGKIGIIPQILSKLAFSLNCKYIHMLIRVYNFSHGDISLKIMYKNSIPKIKFPKSQTLPINWRIDYMTESLIIIVNIIRIKCIIIIVNRFLRSFLLI